MIHDLNRYHRVADDEGKVRPAHVLIAEKALGHSLPFGALVHHVNGDKRDNRNQNLVICEDKSYHALIHRRTEVYLAGGDPDTQRSCKKCGLLRPIEEPLCEECNQRLRDAIHEPEPLRHSADPVTRFALERHFQMVPEDEGIDEINAAYELVDIINRERVHESERWFMAKMERPCLVPKCVSSSDSHRVRGLCTLHYGIAQRLVRRGKVKWESLELQGKVLPATTAGNHYIDPESVEWFLEEPVADEFKAETA